MSIENEVISHYAQKGKDEVSINNQHLHIGGAKATKFVMDKIALTPEMRVLDIGCGVGGPAMLAAEKYGCFVTGIDLTPEFIELARERSARGPHRDKLYFERANVNALDFKDASFDAAFMFHTGMNIPSKQEGYKEIARVLKHGATFLIYDILAIGDLSCMTFPVPWAKTHETSFLETPLDTIAMLKTAGFEISATENCHDYAKNAVTKLLETSEAELNDQRRMIMTNLKTNLDAGLLAPHIVIARKAA